MERGKIKQKAVAATVADKNVFDVFQGIMGMDAGEAPLSIIHPKYLQLTNLATRFIKVLELLRDSRAMSLFSDETATLAEYIARLRVLFDDTFTAPDLSGMTEFSEELSNRFREVFFQVKDGPIVTVMVHACESLIPYQESLKPDRVRGYFLQKGGVLAPFDELPLDFKRVYPDARLDEEDRFFVLMILYKTLEIGKDAYNLATSPDFDPDRAADFLMESLDVVQKQVPRCELAMARIRGSIGMLRNNFGDYFKDYKVSGNGSIIMENFVLDVAKENGDASPQVTQQFKKLIRHYRKTSAQAATDPKLAGLFAHVDANFATINRTQKGGVAPEDDEDTPSEEDHLPRWSPALDTQIISSAEFGDPTLAGGEPSDDGAPNKKTLKRRRQRANAKKRRAAEGDEVSITPDPVNPLAFEFDHEEEK